MGADTFYSIGKGKTAQAAFDNAYKEATFEHGHGGYSGTLAEKPGYVEFDMPRNRTADDLFDALSELSYEDDPTKLPPITKTVIWQRAVTVSGHETLRNVIPAGDKVPDAPTNPYTRAPSPITGDLDRRNLTYVSAEAWEVVGVEDPHPTAVERRAKVEAFVKLPYWAAMCRIFDDKWGPAVCVKAGDGQWAFMGYASS